MNILSVFDGMSCGYIAMKNSGVNIDRYVAYEIDKYAIKTSKHNFPQIEHCGDVFGADFTQYKGFDFLIGGSPCTKWSIAQKSGRETKAEGIGWDLFSQYVRALNESKPRYFIYENNKSMSNEIRDSIRETFGFEEICINSALLSAQNRRRYYWVGKRNEGGTYSKVDIQQPEDSGIILRNVLDVTGLKELSEREMQYMLRKTKDGRNHFDFMYMQDGNKDKGACLTANIHKGVPYNVCCQPIRIGTYPGSKRPECDSKQYRIYSIDGKSTTLCGQGGGICAKTGLYAIPSEENNEKYTVYSVKNGLITMNGIQYPIKLKDGYYIIRKLTVNECKRLQTVPDWFDFSCVSDTQSYKMLGNGWTCDVISHLINGCIN